MSPNKAPSEGQKVDLGRNAPVKEEGAGAVSGGSLAAESAAHGGRFSENTDVNAGSKGSSGSRSTTTNTSTSEQQTENYAETLKADPPTESTTRSSQQTENVARGVGGEGGQGGPAPTYVTSQYAHDKAGPHGKNLHEGIDYKDTEDGIQKALNAEAGSQDDPGRLAEQQFRQSQLRAAGGAGPRQHETGSKTMFDGLNSDSQA